MLPLILLVVFWVSFGCQVWVVERERGALAVLEDRGITEIKGLGNLNHATVKFRKGYAYVISRDGYVSLIDTDKKKLIRRVKVGESSIGLTFCGNRVAVANYDPGTVVILDEDLRVIRVLETGSRNVGIKSWEGKLVFSLMDRDEIWVLSCDGERLATFRVSPMPFDALLHEGVYLVGFFGSGKVGFLDLKTMTYRETVLGGPEEAVLKVPHFGTWGVTESTAYIPAVGERKVYILDLRTRKVKGSIEVPGLPVFVVLSPDGRFIAVSFSGDKEDFVT
ncbi:MAG: cytochrome D1 domain-containing protein, partial [Aquificota bacterium]|nr:cytochrome D1 domain-containing protein [Aquificota bacterium]